MGSPDPFLSALKDVGLSVIRLPRPGLGPLTILLRDGSGLVAAGPIQELMTAGAAMPKVERDQPAAGVAGQRTRDLNASLGINLLSGWVTALGGNGANLDTSFRTATTIRFSFPEVFVDSVNGIAVDKYLAEARVDSRARQLRKMLEDHRVYLITLAAKSRKFSMEITATTGGDAAVSVPALQELVGGAVKVTAAAGRQNAIAYEGTTPVYFGFQALRLFYRDGSYQGFRPMPADEAMMLGDRAGRRRLWFVWNAPFTPLRDDPDLWKKLRE